MEFRALHPSTHINLQHGLAGPIPINLERLFAATRPTEAELGLVREVAAKIEALNTKAAAFSEESLGQRLADARAAVVEDPSEQNLERLTAAVAAGQDPAVRRKVAEEAAGAVQPLILAEDGRLIPACQRLLAEVRKAFQSAVAGIERADERLASIVGDASIAAVLAFAGERVTATLAWLDSLDEQARTGGALALLRDRFSIG